MRLAPEPITVNLGGTHYQLRPTLRAAIRLEREFGIDGLFRGITEGSVSVISRIIGETIDDKLSARTELAKTGDGKVSVMLDELTLPALAVTYQLIGVDPDDQARRNVEGASTSQTSYRDHFRRLLRMGTGWLGWTPDETYSAAPADIIEAYQGHLEKLRVIYGGDAPDTSEHQLDQKLDRDGLMALKAMSANPAR